MKSRLPHIGFMYLALAMNYVYNDPFGSKKTITIPKSSVHQEYSLPLWKVGKHKIYAKNSKDALKYTKKRGLLDGVSMPIAI